MIGTYLNEQRYSLKIRFYTVIILTLINWTVVNVRKSSCLLCGLKSLEMNKSNRTQRYRMDNPQFLVTTQKITAVRVRFGRFKIGYSESCTFFQYVVTRKVINNFLNNFVKRRKNVIRPECSLSIY